MRDPTLGDLLRERRHERGIALSDLARELGVGKSYVSMWENGSRSPSDEHFEALSQMLEVPADVLRVAAGRLPADVATAVSDRAAAVVSAIRCDDAAARVVFPSTLPPDFQKLATDAAAAPGPESEAPFQQSLRAGKNSTSYRAHSYHTKVPPEAIERLLRHHTRKGDLVVDPFCGSGMTGLAAIRSGRNAILSDFSPAAVHIAGNYTTPCDPESFRAAVSRVAQGVRPMMAWLYEYGAPGATSRIEYTVWSDVFRCPGCSARIVYWIGGRDSATGEVRETVRCASCRRHFEKRELRWIGEEPVESNVRGPEGREAHAPTRVERDLISRADSRDVLHWFPQVPFSATREMWRAGHEAAGIATVADFYTRRNLHALSAIRHAIQQEPDERLRSALMFAFTAVVNRASKRYQWNVKRPTNVMTGTLYVSSLRYEWNVWSLFERKVRDVTRHYEDLGKPEARAAVVQTSATSLAHLPNACVDYVFMDPPFGSNIFYADSSLLWDAWLGTLTREEDEIVVNRHRAAAEGGKTLDDYRRLMTEAFREVARILKPTARATLQFNNASAEVWCAIQDALRDADLEVCHAVGLDKVHPSIKGVKGRQALEDVASLDSLIELRRGRRASNGHGDRLAPALENRLLSFAVEQARPFTTDEAFSHLVRCTLTDQSSLAGVSFQAVRQMCEQRFQSGPDGWSPTTRHVQTDCVREEAPPYGCFVAPLLSTETEIRSLTTHEKPAPRARGPAPRVVTGQRNTALYNAHSYHTKVPPEAITPFLQHFTRPGDAVLDPFCGSGMTGVAALQCGRRAILGDLSVAAAHLAFNHTRPCDAAALAAEFEVLARDLAPEIRRIYACADGAGLGYVRYTLWSRDAICPACEYLFSMWDAIDRKSGRMPDVIACPKCRARHSKQSLRYGESRPVLLNFEGSDGRRRERAPTEADLALIRSFTREAITDWYPTVRVDRKREMYVRSALHLQGIDTVADFYTPRNLRALALIWRRVQQVADARVRAALAFAFTNTAWHGTRMRRFNARGGQRPLTGTLYIPQISSEVNVLEVMRRKIRHLHSYYAALGTHSGPLPAVRLGSATRLAEIRDASIDYVFTDPPFGSNIFYADCNLIWDAWLGSVTPDSEEAVVNRSKTVAHGGKSVADYERLMTLAMAEMHRVLKPGAWVTLVFHNTDPAVWRALQAAAESVSFEIVDAGALDRKQQSHKGYKGRAEEEDVAHFDVVMSMRKRRRGGCVSRPTAKTPEVTKFVAEAFEALPVTDRTVQRVHSEVIQRLAREGLDLGSISFEKVRELMPRRRATGG